MKLTSDDIINQNFSNKAVGFNKEEVRAFLEIVATEFEELQNENSLLKRQLSEKDDRVHLMGETREGVKEILNTLQQFSKDTLEVANQNNMFGQQLIKKGEDIIKAMGNKTGAEVLGDEIKELLGAIKGFKEKVGGIQSREVEFTTKDDLKRFVVTAQKIKEEELEKAEERAAQVIGEAHQKAKEMVRQAEGAMEQRKEEASLVVNEAHQRAEEIVREAQNEAEKMRERAAQIIKDSQQEAKGMLKDAENQADKLRQEGDLVVKDAQQRAKEVVKDAEGQAEKMKEEGSIIIKDAQQRARETIKDAQDQADKMKEEGALIIRDAQQKAATIAREAKNEEEKVKITISDLRNQHRLFENRIREAIEFHLTLLNSTEGDKVAEVEAKKEEGNAFSEQNAFSPFVVPNSPFVAPKSGS